MGFSVRPSPPVYVPSSDATLDLWFDPSNTSTSWIQNTSAGSITNGATVGQLTSHGLSALQLIQYGTAPRPTWAISGINGRGAIRSSSQILTALSISGHTSMAGYTLLVVTSRVSELSSQDGAVSWTIPHESGSANATLCFMAANSVRHVRGRRLQADTAIDTSGDTIPNGTPYILTGVWDWTNAAQKLYQDGVFRATAALPSGGGNTASVNPFAFSIGGFASEADSTLSASPSDCFVGEVFGWKRALTNDELIGPFSYLSLRWKIG